MEPTGDYCIGLVRDRDRDRYVATLHSPAAARPALFALHALDLELAQVVAATTEPMLGEIRLAWWREQLARLDGGAVPAQPVLAALAAEVLPRGISGQILEPLEDAMLVLLLEPAPDAAGLQRYAEARGATLFAAMAKVLGGDVAAARALGRAWALGELTRPGLRRTGFDAGGPGTVPPLPRVERALRPLLGLAQLARADLAAVASSRTLAPRGSAGRQARLAWAMLAGR